MSGGMSQMIKCLPNTHEFKPQYGQKERKKHVTGNLTRTEKQRGDTQKSRNKFAIPTVVSW
jgi:hypothetical protein